MEILKAFLPLIIFLLIWVGIGMYYSKKARKHKESIVEDSSTPENCLTLVRGVELTNYLRKYKVILDNSVIGEIASGETKHFNISKGEHELSVKIDWCKSKPLLFSHEEGGNTKILCGASYNDWKCLFMHIIKPSNYVYVRTA